MKLVSGASLAACFLFTDNTSATATAATTAAATTTRVPTSAFGGVPTRTERGQKWCRVARPRPRTVIETRTRARTRIQREGSHGPTFPSLWLSGLDGGADNIDSDSDDSSSTNGNEPQGFGFDGDQKTYGSVATGAIEDLMDTEGAMNAFFSANEEWSPLFRSLAVDADVPAVTFLGTPNGAPIEFDTNSFPWKQMPGMPDTDAQKTVIAAFLDATQQALLDIPVNEFADEDENDMHFLEEGRRLLAISRFHVLSNISGGGSIEDHDELFRLCRSELYELRTATPDASATAPGTGSLILLPHYDIMDLRRFTDMNLIRPLDWLGLTGPFEVASMERGQISAIRIIHGLGDIPQVENYGEEPLRLSDMDQID